MKRYVDGYVLTVRKKELGAYKKMAQVAGKTWIKHGALEYNEFVAQDMRVPKECGMPFPDLVNPKKGEVIMFSYIVYKSRTHRDKVNAKVMKDPAMDPKKWENKPMPFDMKRMAFGGFESLVLYSKKK